MTNKEIIKRVIKRDFPPRIGFNFTGDNPNDFIWGRVYKLMHPQRDKYAAWGFYPEIAKQVPHFGGEVRVTQMGNIYGRLDQKTSGECIKGALQDGWHLLDAYQFPEVTDGGGPDYTGSDKYILGDLPCAVFSVLRDARLINNALMDTLLEEENVTRFLEMAFNFQIKGMDMLYKKGMDGIAIYDDLGMQHAPFFSPEVFRKLFKPFYRKIAEEAHSRDMDFFVHSCGNVTCFIDDFIDAGVDVFQFDQPELHGVERLAQEFGHRAAFQCPVDIQKIMATGDRELIVNAAKNMAESFKKTGGGLIAMDYGSWHDLDVLPEWQQWARDTFVEYGNM